MGCLLETGFFNGIGCPYPSSSRFDRTISTPSRLRRKRGPDLLMYSDNGQSAHTSSLLPLLRHSGPLSQSYPRFLDDIF